MRAPGAGGGRGAAGSPSAEGSGHVALQAASPASRRAALACSFCIGLCAVFFFTAVLPLPVPMYYPIARRWTLGATEPGLSMDYYGRSLLGLLGGAAAVALTLLAQRVLRRLGRPGLPLFLGAAWALTALALCASLYAYKLVGREVTPEPLPAWYQPR